MQTARKQSCGYLDDARQVWKQRMCLEAVSKNLSGGLQLLDRQREECEEPKCRTLKTDHLLKLEVKSHEPCDSEVGRLLDGVLVVRRLVHALADGTGNGRGLHTGEFTWSAAGVEIVGEISGMTNEGTHREPPFDPCQQCDDRGYMEGRLCGRIVKADDKRLVGCRVTAAYRLRFDPSEGFQDTGVTGTLEGLVVCPCGKGKCINFATFPQAGHTNPWQIGDCTFEVFDYTGTATPTTEVVTWGGHTGLNAGFNTIITFANPVSDVSITLVHFSSPATAVAYDGNGNVVDSTTMTVAGSPETLGLSGQGIVRVEIRPPQNETLILEVCSS